MKIKLLFCLFVSLQLGAQQDVIDLVRNGKNTKIEKWLQKNPSGTVQTLQYEVENLIRSYGISSDPSFSETMNILELSILFKNDSLTHTLLYKTDIGKDVTILSLAVSKAIIVNDYELLLKLLKLGGTFDQTCIFCHNRNNLQLAFGNAADKKIVDLVIKNSSNEDFLHIDFIGSSTLHMLTGYPDTHYLMNYFPILESYLDSENILGQKPFHTAISEGNEEAALFLWSKMSANQKEAAFLEFPTTVFESPRNMLRINDENTRLIDSLEMATFGFIHNTKLSTDNTFLPLYEFYNEIYTNNDFPKKTQEIFEFYNEHLGANLNLRKDYLKFKNFINLDDFIFYRDLVLNTYFIDKVKAVDPEKTNKLIDEYTSLFKIRKPCLLYYDTLQFETNFVSYELINNTVGMSVLMDYKYQHPFLSCVYVPAPDEATFELISTIFKYEMPNLILDYPAGNSQEELDLNEFPAFLECKTIRVAGIKKIIFPSKSKNNIETLYITGPIEVENLPSNTKIENY